MKKPPAMQPPGAGCRTDLWNTVPTDNSPRPVQRASVPPAMMPRDAALRAEADATASNGFAQLKGTAA
jgi:hypothetical protein